MKKTIIAMMSAVSMFVGNVYANIAPSDVVYEVAIYDLQTKDSIYEAKIPGFMLGASDANVISDGDSYVEARQNMVNMKFLPRSIDKNSIKVGVGGNFQVSDKNDSLPMSYQVVKFKTTDFVFKDGYSYVADAVDSTGRRYRLVVNASINM